MSKVWQPVKNGIHATENAGTTVETDYDGSSIRIKQRSQFDNGDASANLPDHLALCQLVDAPGMPQPDWDAAPEWAQWWTIDADGDISYWANEPRIDLWVAMWWDDAEGEVWAPEGEGNTDIPLGIDWRALRQQRPGAAGQGGE